MSEAAREPFINGSEKDLKRVLEQAEQTKRERRHLAEKEARRFAREIGARETKRTTKEMEIGDSFLKDHLNNFEKQKPENEPWGGPKFQPGKEPHLDFRPQFKSLPPKKT